MTARKLGRPASNTRDEVLAMALHIVTTEGMEALSMRKLAAALNTAPTSIYNYFNNKEALINAVAEGIFKGLATNVSVKKHGSMSSKLSQWMYDFRQNLLNTPAFFSILPLAAGSHSNLAAVSDLSNLLINTGFNEREAVMHAQSLIWTVINFTYSELGALDQSVIDNMEQGLKTEPALHIRDYVSVRNFDDMFDITVERNIQGLTALLKP